MMSKYQRTWFTSVMKAYEGRCQFCNGNACRIRKIEDKEPDTLRNLTTTCGRCLVIFSMVTLHPAFIRLLKDKARERIPEIKAIKNKHWEDES